MPLNWIWNSTQANEVTIEWDTNKDETPNHENTFHSTVIKTEEFNENEKKITINIPLLDGTSIEVTWTYADIIIIRKRLEVEGKIPLVSNHDDLIQRNLQDNKDKTRWEYWWRWSSLIVDTVAEKQKKEQEKEKRKKLIQDIKNSLKDSQAIIQYTTEQSKNALFEVLIVSEEKIKSLLSKKNINKTGEVIWWIIEKWIYYAMPWLEWTIPSLKKQIVMTWKQILDIFKTRKKSNKEDQDITQ